MWMVVLDPDDLDPRAIQMVYFLARHAAIAASTSPSNVDTTAAIEDAIADINRIVSTTGELKSQLSNIGIWHDRAASTQ